MPKPAALRLPLAALLIACALPALAVELWYDFEADAGDEGDFADFVDDELDADGPQDGQLEGLTRVQSSQALFGSQSLELGIPQLYSSFEIPGSTNPGSSFTIPALPRATKAI